MNILFTGAHTDDIEHGAGGVFCRYLQEGKHKIRYVSFSRCTDLARNKGILMEQDKVCEYIEKYNGSVHMMNFSNRQFPSCTEVIRERLENEQLSFSPDIVFTHWKHDIHQDHKTLADECIKVFRNNTVLGYECIRSCPDFIPNMFIALNKEDIQNKINLLSLYETQKNLYYTDDSVIRSLAVVRGANIGKLFAEGFDLVRGIIE